MEGLLLVFKPGLLEGPVQVILQLTKPLQAAGLQGVLRYLPVLEVLGESDHTAVVTRIRVASLELISFTERVGRFLCPSCNLILAVAGE